MEDYSQFVPNVHFELIPIRNLVSNQEYQRSLSQTHVELAAENFDLRQINPVKVSRRNGICYVFNGQHTVEIVAMRSGSNTRLNPASSNTRTATGVVISFPSTRSSFASMRSPG